MIAPVEERKVVTVLFCDLVGFTTASESADPEDVRRWLAPYHSTLRDTVEQYGGTVEKFAGDAILAVFGAPRSRRTTPSARSGPGSRSSTRSRRCRPGRWRSGSVSRPARRWSS